MTTGTGRERSTCSNLQPAISAALADEDEGHDPNKLETALLRDRFDRHEIYLSLAAKAEGPGSPKAGLGRTRQD